MANKESIELIKTSSKVRIEIGVFEPDASKYEKVKILNADDTVTEMEMKVSDIMYFMEYGTLTLPALHILKKIKTKVQPELKALLNSFLMLGYSDDKKVELLKFFIDKIEHVYIPNTVDEVNVSNNNINRMLKSEDTNKFLFDLNKLKKYIKCEIFFEK